MPLQKPERCSGLPLPKFASRTQCACKFGRRPQLCLGCFCRRQRLGDAATHSSLFLPLAAVAFRLKPHGGAPAGRRGYIYGRGAAQLRRCLRQKQPKRSRGSGLSFARARRRPKQKQGTATVPPQAAERAMRALRSDQTKQKSARFRALCAFVSFCKKEKEIQKVSSAFGSRVIRRWTASAGLMPWLTTAFTVWTMGIST